MIPDLIFDIIPNAFHDCRLRLLQIVNVGFVPAPIDLRAWREKKSEAAVEPWVREGMKARVKSKELIICYSLFRHD